MAPPENDKAKQALIGAAQTIARASTIDSAASLPALEDGDTLYTAPSTQPPQVSDASAALDDAGPRYQRTELLGEGGMGQVWQVRDGRVGRRVAMKLMRLHDATDEAAKARFLREARVQGQLEHPAVVPVYDLGRSPEGELFFTMKRVRGHTLSSVVEQLRDKDPRALERYTLRRLLTAFSQICLTVEYAHARGVLHRDLKPDNVMLGDHGEVYVLDWGVARVLRDDLVEGDEASLSPEALLELAKQSNQTGLVGTPGYIAPEQLKGKQIGPSSDVYALGAILFELITLEPLAGGGNVLSRLERTMNGIDTAALLEKRDGLSPELQALCVRATTLDPMQRLPTARVLHEAIERYLDGERDLQLRRELAERHLGAARDAVSAGGDELEGHKRALRETGRALAIMPDHPDARRMILSLFAAPPKATPDEVEHAIENERAHQSRITAKTGALGMSSMLLFLPLLVMLGIRNWIGIGIFFAMTVGAVAISAVASKAKQRSATLLYVVVFFNNLVFGLCAGMYGPLVLVPSMVITNTITFALHLEGWPRRFAILSGCAAVALPVLLSAAGITPSSYIPSGDGILLRPLWLEFPPMWTIVFLTLSTLIAIINGSRSVGQVREALTEAERRNQMQRWQLSQLLPDEPSK
jgi:serine/threonine protein kinase